MVETIAVTTAMLQCDHNYAAWLFNFRNAKMIDKINKTYKPKELEDAQHILKECSDLDFHECIEVLLNLHKHGWRLVKC